MLPCLKRGGRYLNVRFARWSAARAVLQAMTFIVVAIAVAAGT